MPLLGSESNAGSRVYCIEGLASPYCSTPTKLRDEVILAAWLMLLMRIQDTAEVNFEWQYEYAIKNAKRPNEIQRLSPRDVILSPDSHVGQVCALVANNITTDLQEQSSSPPASIKLSTRSFSDETDAAKDEQHVQLSLNRHENDISIQPTWHSHATPEWTVTRLIDVLVETIKFCIDQPSAKIQDCSNPTRRDLDDIWLWNHKLPETHDFCMHELISTQAQHLTEKLAISSWDGDLTYAQVNEYSDITARRLIQAGVKHDDFIPLCFEKSRWTIVAVLAVMKAGGTLVMMDSSLPLARLQNMAKQVNGTIMLSSRLQQDFAKAIIPDGTFLIVESDAFTNISRADTTTAIPSVPTATIMYLIFTSGSTGTPKGVQVSHRTYTSSALPRAKAVGYTAESRVLDFASYAFDVSIDSMLLTLGNGGCLCIPSDEDRMNDINGAIRRMKINYAGLTPSVARILDSDVIDSLEGLGLGGEAASVSDVTLWGRSTRIIIGYGPCECTIGCTINGDTATGRPYISIGTGNGAAIWIVDPNDHEKLLPVGAVGELLVEGPIVGQGYLDDPAKTAASFIDPPSWLVNGHNRYSGRSTGRLYKTGDLGKYDPDGSGGIVFVGRKDTQVKLRGQRVELGEIESQLTTFLPPGTKVIAEIIKPHTSGGQSVLVAFVKFPSGGNEKESEISQANLSQASKDSLQEAQTEIQKVLPRYMVPTAYIPVNSIPVLISGKTDRKVLRQFGSTIDLQQLDQVKDEASSLPLTDSQISLSKIWCEILKIHSETIHASDNFFSLGGDSLAAMKLVSACRAHGLEISVIQAFSNPRLNDMAQVIRPCALQAVEDIQPFSLSSLSTQDARLEAAEACDCDIDAVQDVYPCTPTQESLFTFSLRSSEAYIAQRVATIPKNIDIEQLKNAWNHVMAANPILRTRVAQLSGSGLQQVVLDEKAIFSVANNLKQYLAEDAEQKLELGEPLSRYAVVTNSTDGTRYMVWTVHHVLYDGWSEPMILQQLSQYLQNDTPMSPPAQMRHFVHYLNGVNVEDQKKFWRDELRGATGPQFPPLPTRDYVPTPDGFVERRIGFTVGDVLTVTKATVLRAAWALLAARHTGSNDVVFGETLTGRDIPIPGVEGIIGPMIATIPMRVAVDRKTSVKDYLHAVQRSVLARIPYQHMGMQNIRRVSPDAQYACEAGTGLVIQPEPEYDGNDLGFPRGDPVREALHFNPYPLMLAFGIREDGLRVCASFDSSLVSVRQMEHMLSQLEITCQQLLADLERPVGEVTSLPHHELEQLWQWNKDAPLVLNRANGTIHAGSDISQGSLYPRVATPWVCDPNDHNVLAPLGSIGELFLEGDMLTGEILEAPSWLAHGHGQIKGRKNTLRRTGDLVRIQLDGSIHFVGRKHKLVAVENRGFDPVDLERYAANYLPKQSRFVVTFEQTESSEAEEKQGRRPILAIEALVSDEPLVQVLGNSLSTTNGHHDPLEPFLGIKTSFSPDIVAATKKLDKFVKDSLPWVPSNISYIVVDKLPTDDTGLVNRDQLSKAIGHLEATALAQIRSDLESAWRKLSVDNDLDGPSEILRSAWSDILSIPKEKIDVDDNFFRLGGDSVLAMKLVSKLRVQGQALSVAQVFQNMRLSDAARVMKPVNPAERSTPSYKPFSMLEGLNVQELVSTIESKLNERSWAVQDVLPISGVQRLDINATTKKPRTSLQYVTLAFTQGIDQGRLIEAYKDLVQMHEILRTLFIQHDNNFYQVVIRQINAVVACSDAKQCSKKAIEDVCRADAEEDVRIGEPFTKAFLIRGGDGNTAFVLRLSHAQYDGTSLPLLLRDLERLYAGSKSLQSLDSIPFSAYVNATRDKKSVRNAQRYWQHLLEGSKLSVLPRQGSNDGKSLFLSQKVEIGNRPAHITTSTLLTAAWAILLSRRLNETDVTFGAVTTGRSLDFPNADQVVGPCYNIMPVRIRLQTPWKASEILGNIQTQVAKSASYDFLTFEEVVNKCTNWSNESSFFNSIVHHQDFEDFDEMAFADTSCAVDLVNPYGDAAEPFKAVTFQRHGQLNVGVVGYESEAAMCQSILDGLVGIFVELTM